ncbi:NXPE family member 3-like isoform X3 [Haliotis asinina]|uniref:NXPE family member 3-like isoform X3 n=1 Tax=Haliotis asinina TaxID=109174 RepID=UPI0035323E62
MKTKVVFVFVTIFGVFCSCLLVMALNSRQSTSLSKPDVKEEVRRSSDWQGPMSVDGKTLSELKAVKGNPLASAIAQTDPKSCSYAPYSNIQLASSKTDFKLGDTISVKIQLFDEYKRRKTTGGDNVRIWMSEKSKEARAAGVVTDNKDGTYIGTLKALWAGSPKIEASIASRKENVDIFYRVYHDFYTLRNLSAMFESDGVKEETLCLPVPNIRGFTNVCNLTAENYGLPWYCGKPSHRKLLCHDFTGLREPDKQPSLFTSHEANFFKGNRLHQTISTAVQIKVSSDQEIVSLPSVPCNRTPLRKSWEASTPVGFFYKNSWKSLTCTNTIPDDSKIYKKCLKNRRFWIHGDSSSRSWFNVLTKRLGLKLVTEEWDHSKWHKPAVTMDKNWNISLMLVPHEYPFYHGYTFNKLAYNRATHAYLDDIPNNSNDIFVIHIYLHFNPFPPEVFKTHMQRIVRSVKSLVARAPGVKVAIRGTHAFKGRGKIGFLDDCWMYPYDAIQREAFKGLENNVLFLNNVDLTVATENDDQHPNPLAVDSLINHLMGSVCEG